MGPWPGIGDCPVTVVGKGAGGLGDASLVPAAAGLAGGGPGSRL